MTVRSAFSKFLPNEANKRMFPAFACFIVAVIGGILAFVADAYQFRTLGQVAFVVTAIAVICGCATVLWLMFRTLSGRS